MPGLRALQWVAWMGRWASIFWMPPGGNAALVLAYVVENPSLGGRIVPELPHLKAETRCAVHHEMALTLSDFPIRRTHLIHERRVADGDRPRMWTD